MQKLLKKMFQFFKNNWFLNCLKIIGILICFWFLKFNNIWIDSSILLFSGLLYLNYNSRRFQVLSNVNLNFFNHLMKSPGLIAFFTTLLNLFKTNQDIAGDLKQAIIMGILIHLATLPSNRSNANSTK